MTDDGQRREPSAEPASSELPNDVEALKALLEDEREKAQSFMHELAARRGGLPELQAPRRGGAVGDGAVRERGADHQPAADGR